MLKVTVNNIEYSVEPSLHAGFYQISSDGISALINKHANGSWELTLPTSNAVDLPVQELGKAIESLDTSGNTL